ncbi:hypothetical protein BLNAU_23080 [Blattamonas nauphoetae]|uniref:SbsA Ig-like domain-containing protein n=1 Tax=Blattamonas nauphoetae TaxID=2049346 RepID=A0ABQ9WRB5_9EUKA|nr:hypothetical protein BLNAU_23080 [Blattamonas nauphoetae]
MFFLFALLSASSFRAPNAAFTITHTTTLDADKKGSILVEGAATAKDTTPQTLTLKYAPPPASNAVEVVLSETQVAIDASDGSFTHTFKVAVAATGDATTFESGVEYTLTVATITAEDGMPATAPKVTFTLPTAEKTLALVYTEASATTYTVAATFGDEQKADVVVTFTPAEGTAVPVTFAFTDATKGKTASATLTVGAEGSATVFKIGTKYTAALADYTVTGKDFTPANPLTTVYASLLTPVDPEKKDGAKDKVSMTCTNGIIKASLVEGETKTQTLVVKEGESAAITLTQTADKINFTITAGQCVVDYLYNDAKIAKGKTGTAKLTLGATEFLEGNLTFDGSKSVASIIAALLAVLAIVF